MLKTKNRSAFPPLPKTGPGVARTRGGWVVGVALALVCLTGCLPPGPAALLEGKKLLEHGKPAAAIAPLSDATAILKTNALAWSYLGLAHQQVGQLNEAVAAYGLALRYNRDLTEVHYNLGCALLDLGKADAAKAEFTAYTLRQTRDANGWLKLGQAQLRLHDVASAEKSFGESLRLSPTNAPALENLGLAQYQRSHYREAVQFFNQALKQDPTARVALRSLALVQYQNLHNYPAALDAFRVYVALTPRPADADSALAIIHELQQKLAPPQPPVSSNVVAAEAASRTAPKPAPTNVVAVALPRPAPTNVAAAPNVRPAATNLTAAAPVRTAVPPTNSGAAPVRPVAPVVHHPPPAAPRGELPLTQLSDRPEFQPAQDVEANPAAAPGAAAARPAVAAEATTAGDPARKRGFFSKLNPVNLFRKEPKVTPLPPASTTASATVADNASPAKPGDVVPEPLVTPAPTIAAPPPEPPPLVVPRYSYRSLAKPGAGNRAAAMVRFSAAMQAASAGRFGEAAEDYRKATQADPAFFEAYYNLALTEQNQRQVGPALVDYEHALAINPAQAGSADARYNFALALRDAGYLLDAAAELQKLLAQNPAEVRAQLALANLYAQKLRQPQSARVHYLKVLDLDPRHPQAASIHNWLQANPG